MVIGIPREIKDGEARVAATPDTVRALAAVGHAVLVETRAGRGSGFSDDAYRAAGAQVVSRPDEIYACPLVVKVKELQPDEYRRVKPGSILAGYHQLARDAHLLDVVLDRRVTCLAYEGVVAKDGSRPLVAPMSAIAGLLAAQIAAWALQRREGPLAGSGVLLPWLQGVPQAHVLIVGEGVAGSAAARTFLSLGCHVAVLGQDPAQIARLQERLAGCGRSPLETAPSTPAELTQRIAHSDVVVGAVSVPDRLSPKLITRPMLRSMRPGSVFIDIGIDVGGIAETSRQTRLSDPLYVEEGVLHYCVPNIPALVPRAASQTLTTATLPYVEAVAERGLDEAMEFLPGLRNGLLVYQGHVVHAGLAEDAGREFTDYSTLPHGIRHEG